MSRLINSIARLLPSRPALSFTSACTFVFRSSVNSALARVSRALLSRPRAIHTLHLKVSHTRPRKLLLANKFNHLPPFLLLLSSFRLCVCLCYDRPFIFALSPPFSPSSRSALLPTLNHYILGIRSALPLNFARSRYPSPSAPVLNFLQPLFSHACAFLSPQFRARVWLLYFSSRIGDSAAVGKYYILACAPRLIQ